MSDGATKQSQKKMVTLTIDGQVLSVPEGTNIIEAARTIGIDIPHYCYHRHLTIAGNCRLCQVKIKGFPKLEIGCNTKVKEGMEVSTDRTSEEVKTAQAAILEFLLINHPLDCTVCDAAGHCKLQDYHFQYNAKASRFIERKENKVKAEPLGRTIVLDGERCVLCTRCVRFCDEITKTHELGMLNRGDRAVISLKRGHELNNPLSGTVADLCPVGALTHRPWRFNTRIWYTKETESICPGCSTGCNCKVAVREQKVMYVKGRLNSEVNKEWMCDEGRYGFHRFRPERRQTKPLLKGEEVSWEAAMGEAAKLLRDETLVFMSPDLVLEEYLTIRDVLNGVQASTTVCVLNYWERSLNEVEKILISPDYACNFRGALLSGLVYGDLESACNNAIERVKQGSAKSILFVGDRAVDAGKVDSLFWQSVSNAPRSVAIACDAASPLVKSCSVILPAQTILERSGFLINRGNRVQYTERCCDQEWGTEPVWSIMRKLGNMAGASLPEFSADRDLSLHYIANEERLKGLTLGSIKRGGVGLEDT